MDEERRRTKWTCCMYVRDGDFCRALSSLACDEGGCKFHKTTAEARAARYRSMARRVAIGVPLTQADKELQP